MRAGRNAIYQLAALTVGARLRGRQRIILSASELLYRAIDRALVKSERRVQAAQEALDRIRERATVDNRGRRVYRTADRQRGFTEDGQELSREEVASIHWKPDAPTWEEHIRRPRTAWQGRSKSMKRFCAPGNGRTTTRSAWARERF
jgi:hypothetical protein